MAWDRPILTDSGGFQVFSLEVAAHARRRRRDVPLAPRRQHASLHARKRRRVSGSARRRHRDGARRLRQAAGRAATRSTSAVRRTTALGARCAAARARAQTLLFGIVQGGLDERLRARERAPISSRSTSRLRDRRALGRRVARGDEHRFTALHRGAAAPTIGRAT
jgi:queuine tRNA-ribosyltransferase